jgi:hypothetical protein
MNSSPRSHLSSRRSLEPLVTVGPVRLPPHARLRLAPPHVPRRPYLCAAATSRPSPLSPPLVSHLALELPLRSSSAAAAPADFGHAAAPQVAGCCRPRAPRVTTEPTVHKPTVPRSSFEARAVAFSATERLHADDPLRPPSGPTAASVSSTPASCTSPTHPPAPTTSGPRRRRRSPPLDPRHHGGPVR